MKSRLLHIQNNEIKNVAIITKIIIIKEIEREIERRVLGRLILQIMFSIEIF